MLLTLTTTHRPATALGFLLHKHPDRVRSVSLPFGMAHVFFPEATEDRCTAALLLDVDPIGLVRGRPESAGGGLLAQYVNDRPYAASSFLSVAIAKLFGTAMGGRAYGDHQALMDAPLALSAEVAPLACRGGPEIAQRLFEPLGYDVAVTGLADEPDRPSGYWRLSVSGLARLPALLSHLYVLVPVIDNAKHYWIGDDEIEKLLRKGEGWLAAHPERDLIARRYLKHRGSLAREALQRLAALDDTPVADETGPTDTTVEGATEPAAPRVRLNEQRLQQVAETLKDLGAKSVVDLGCGEGRLLARLMREKQFERILGVDISLRSLEIARERLKLDRPNDRRAAKVELIQSALTYRDRRLAGFDAIAVVEVIEHIDVERLEAFAEALFGAARPRAVVLTTPNREYNDKYEAMEPGEMRHADHRFEWSRAEFEAWARRIGETYGYEARFEAVGEADPELGPPTQMAVFQCS